MIGNLLDFSKLKANKIELNKAPTNIKETVKSILKMNYFKAKEKGNTLKLLFSKKFPKKVITDEQRIKQILINLISNAIKFTSKGTVTVSIGWHYEVPLPDGSKI